MHEDKNQEVYILTSVPEIILSNNFLYWGSKDIALILFILQSLFTV